jgi:hypothetical protein
MTARAISSDVPSLQSGTMVGIIFKPCWHAFDELSRPSVSIQPGLTVLTRTRRSFKSVVHVLANERRAAFVALYVPTVLQPRLLCAFAWRAFQRRRGGGKGLLNQLVSVAHASV